ncbi:MAG TPA: histidine--tRNA ligase [Candidatus Megaira endosymbiont of Hartmannula sinica]|nr:histidine--tRNA ligase [Candidatus Megaera endosymbiont of Hartmannula sinica]
MKKNSLRIVRGMKDIVKDEQILFDYIIDIATRISKNYSFDKITTPILEYTNVFDRTLGSDSDIVSKEMYNFTDKGGNNVCMRPEFTAAIMRNLLSSSDYGSNAKLFSVGPLFRYDRPQKGRLRQFHQVNFENIGEKNNIVADIELISMAYDFLSNLGIINHVHLEINHLASEEVQSTYNKVLMEYFKPYYEFLSSSSKKRFDNNNPLRIIDSKDYQDQDIIKNVPLISDYYSESDIKYLDTLISALDALSIKCHVNPLLMRGLDYYEGVTFEFIYDNSGSKQAVAAGGRYDRLSSIMSDKDNTNMKAIGFAAGIERIMIIMQHYNYDQDVYIKYKNKKKTAVINMADEYLIQSLELVKNLRNADKQVNIYSTGKISKRIERALNDDMNYIVFVGEDEVMGKYYTVKNLQEKSQDKMTLKDILAIL